MCKSLLTERTLELINSVGEWANSVYVPVNSYQCVYVRNSASVAVWESVCVRYSEREKLQKYPYECLQDSGPGFHYEIAHLSKSLSSVKVA